jgi:hypothetical protein
VTRPLIHSTVRVMLRWCVLSCCRVRRGKCSLKQQRNCKHDDSQGILSLSMGNEPVQRLEVSQNKDRSKDFEIGLSVRVFRHIDQTVLWCSLFKSGVLLASRLMTENPEKVWIHSVLVWIEELNESKPLLKCRK